MRFSLLALIGFVTLAAIGCAALVDASELWLATVSTGTFVIVATAVLVGLYGQATGKAFGGGFAICSLAYLALAWTTYGRNMFLTEWLLIDLHRAVATRTNTGVIIRPHAGYFMPIGQQLWALLIGCLGGLLASYLCQRR